MSEYRDSLDEETRARYDAAIQNAGRIIAAIIRDHEPGGLIPAEQAA